MKHVHWDNPMSKHSMDSHWPSNWVGKQNCVVYFKYPHMQLLFASHGSMAPMPFTDHNLQYSVMRSNVSSQYKWFTRWKIDWECLRLLFFFLHLQNIFATLFQKELSLHVQITMWITYWRCTSSLDEFSYLVVSDFFKLPSDSILRILWGHKSVMTHLKRLLLLFNLMLENCFVGNLFVLKMLIIISKIETSTVV